MGFVRDAVLTIHLRADKALGPTKRAETRVLEFFKQRLQTAA